MSSPPNYPPGPPRQSSSFKISATKPPRKPSWKKGTFEVCVPCYDLAEEDIRTWLKKRFKNHKLDRRSVELHEDKWILTVPEQLTEAEKCEIEALAEPTPDEVEADC